MVKVRPGLFAVLLVCMSAVAPVNADDADSIKPFDQDSLDRILAARRGQPFLLVLWSIDCLPCRAELALLEESLGDHPDMDVVLVNADNYALRDKAHTVLSQYRLTPAEFWMFSDRQAQRLRYRIDHQWFGELPRSYFYDAGHARVGISGPISRAMIERWLLKRNPG